MLFEGWVQLIRCSVVTFTHEYTTNLVAGDGNLLHVKVNPTQYHFLHTAQLWFWWWAGRSRGWSLDFCLCLGFLTSLQQRKCTSRMDLLGQVNVLSVWHRRCLSFLQCGIRVIFWSWLIFPMMLQAHLQYLSESKLSDLPLDRLLDPYTVKSRTAHNRLPDTWRLRMQRYCRRTYSHIPGILCTFRLYILFEDGACVVRTAKFLNCNVAWQTNIDLLRWTARHVATSNAAIVVAINNILMRLSVLFFAFCSLSSCIFCLKMEHV